MRTTAALVMLTALAVLAACGGNDNENGKITVAVTRALPGVVNLTVATGEPDWMTARVSRATVKGEPQIEGKDDTATFRGTARVTIAAQPGPYVFTGVSRGFGVGRRSYVAWVDRGVRLGSRRRTRCCGRRTPS